MRKINLNLYRIFLEVYETKSITSAARNLRLTQPTITYNIKELEKQLELRLFNTSPKGVEPTTIANEIFPLIQNAFTSLSKAENIVQKFSNQGKPHLEVSTHSVSQITASLIAAFNKQYPDIKLDKDIANKATLAFIESIKKHHEEN